VLKGVTCVVTINKKTLAEASSYVFKKPRSFLLTALLVCKPRITSSPEKKRKKHRPNSYYTQRPVRRTSSPISLPILPIIPSHHTQSASKFPSQFRDGPNILLLAFARAHAFNVAEQPALPCSACAAVQLGCSTALEAESTGGTETRRFGDAAAAIAALLTHGAVRSTAS
jgi:hypothetical protein